MIEGKLIAIKKGTSFEYVSENRFFKDADDYSMSITVPLKGCEQNREVFGDINRKEAEISKKKYKCEIQSGRFIKKGIATIVEVSEVEVKLQFLEGKSATNKTQSEDEENERYIDELQTRSIHQEMEDVHNDDFYFRTYDQQKQGDYIGAVFYPWVNTSSNNIQNNMYKSTTSNNWKYMSATGQLNYKLVGQPFLIEVIKQVIESGENMQCDLRALESSQWKDAIVCNALPYVWRLEDMARAWPHWTYREFFEEMERFLGGDFIREGGTIRFAFHKDQVEAFNKYVITQVVDEYKVEITKEEKASSSDVYKEQRNYAYTDCNNNMWQYLCCDWAIKKAVIRQWASIQDMVQGMAALKTNDGNYQDTNYEKIHHAQREDTYYTWRAYTQIGGQTKLRLQPVNIFAPLVRDKNGQKEEMKIVPAYIDEVGGGDMIFLECGSYEGGDYTDDDKQPRATQIIKNGEKSSSNGFYDKMYVAFITPKNEMGQYKPCPMIDPYYLDKDNNIHMQHATMRLKGAQSQQKREQVLSIDMKKKYSFSFLSEELPNVLSIFIIHGKKYLAEKITATFNEAGISKLMKLTAYRIE